MELSRARVGEVMAASIDEDCLEEGKLSLEASRPIAQKNWDYHTLSDI